MQNSSTLATLAPPAAPAEIRECPVGFRSDVVIDVRDGVLRLLSPIGGYALNGVAPAVVEALRDIVASGTALADGVEKLSDTEAGQLYTIAERAPKLAEFGILLGGRLLVKLEATARDAHYEKAAVPLDVRVKLSKFVLLRSHAGALVLESPLARHRVTLVAPAAGAAITALGGGCTGADLLGELPEAAVSSLLGHLVGAGFVETEAVDGGVNGFPSDTDPVLRQWDFHDLVTHSRARTGRFDQPFGGIFPFLGEIEPQPALKPVPTGPSIVLDRPELEDILAVDPSLTTVLEARTSVRDYGETPLSVAQIGEFLYRTARVRAVYGPSEATPYEASTRPYPCGGAAYELELYLTVRRCDGIEPGCYYYDPVGHRLVLVNEDPSDRQAMLHAASVATAMQANADILITMTARHQRLSWKYRSMAYSVSLKHAGVLYQTMYLVATAMGLAPCGLGSGDADLAARVLGLDYLTESSVGDFILGSRAVPQEGATARRLPENWRPVNDPQWGVQSQSTLFRRFRGPA
ncbi:SagB/ThcOx family dehydrogenase [Streptacidiphilus jiangxiensis]|uniref:SagB-type dehydrogenase domain-containing protein n=1 Tax=Streptacidiphilus jiangxiensis TaxID=235985 RepID=A0A1H7KRD0_STRJI|nr:SagB family peptide dehydrogenase [Streptacidiphilus jiangxiensis]SEK89298.1 SagB-type dehydrogenase domain-containing protein [Streptacidiphilus jiangxiensis]